MLHCLDRTQVRKVQKEEYLVKNACYSVTKYYLCKQNNKRSLLGRIQRLEVVRSFPNRYQFSCINKVTSLFSDRYIFIIIFNGHMLTIEEVNILLQDGTIALKTFDNEGNPTTQKLRLAKNKH